MEGLIVVNGQYTLHSVSTVLTLSGDDDCSIFVMEKFTFSFSSPFSVISRQLPSSVGMPSGNLVIDKNSDIFVDSPQVSLSSPSVLVSADGKTILFRVYFVDGKELLNHDKVTLIYGYNLLRGPMSTDDNISQLRWHTSFSIPVSQVSFKFIYENNLFNQKSIKSNDDFYSYSQSISGTTYNIMEFNATNVTAGSLFVGSFNATNMKYSTCVYGQQQSDNLFFYSIIVPLLIGFALVLALSLVVILFQRCCRRRSSVLDHQIADFASTSRATRTASTNNTTVVLPKRDGKHQQAGDLYYVTNTFNNVENNDGFTGVVVSHLNQESDFPNGPSATDEVVIQYTPTLHADNADSPEQTV